MNKSGANVAWRVFSLVLVLGLLAIFISGAGKPLLTAFVVSDSDYNADVDSAVVREVQDGGETRVVVKLKDEAGVKGFALDDASDVGNKLGDEKVNYVSDSDNVLSADIDSEDLEALRSNPSVLEVTPMKEISFFLQDSAKITGANSTWTYQFNSSGNMVNITGAGQTVCVIDTGVNFSHSDFSGKNALGVNGNNIDCVTADCVENASVGDDHGHGTFVAGIAVANGNIRGIAPDAKLIGVKVLNSQGSGYEDDLKLGMEWCIDHAATYNISVISLSLGTSTLYTSACDNVDDDLNITASVNRAVSNNIAVVAATGNTGSTTGIAAPACISNSTAVGAVDKSDGILFNRNAMTDLLAPGSSINSTIISGGYSSASGTSMSTPHVSGAFALLQQFYKLNNSAASSVALIENTLKDTGRVINDSGTLYSRIDVYSGLLSLLGISSNQSSENQTGNQTSVAYYITTTLNNPSDNSYSGLGSSVVFSCAASTNYTNATMSSISLNIWNSAGNKIYNESYTSSLNSSSVNNNFTYSTSSLNNNSVYSWNCLAQDNQGNSGFASSNRTFTHDSSSPTVSLIHPDTGITNSTSNVLRFYFSADDNYGINNCNLTINSQNMGTKGGINNLSNYFIYTIIENGQKIWSVTCRDLGGNSVTSDTRTMTLSYSGNVNPGNNDNSSAGSSSGGGGGGGSGEEEVETRTLPVKYSLSSSEAFTGQTYTVAPEDEIKFVINKDGSDVTNTIRIDAIGLHTLRVSFVEKKMIQTIIEGEEKKLSLEYTDKEDTLIALKSITAGKAEFVVRSLVSPPSTPATTDNTNSPTTGNVINEEDLKQADTGASKLSGFVVGIKENSKYLIALAAIMILAAAYLVFRKVRSGSWFNWGSSKGVSSSSKSQRKATPTSGNTKSREFLDSTLDDLEKKKN